MPDLYAYVDPAAGDDGTGVANANPVTAAASPYQTLAAAESANRQNLTTLGGAFVIRVREGVESRATAIGILSANWPGSTDAYCVRIEAAGDGYNDGTPSESVGYTLKCTGGGANVLSHDDVCVSLRGFRLAQTNYGDALSHILAYGSLSLDRMVIAAEDGACVRSAGGADSAGRRTSILNSVIISKAERAFRGNVSTNDHYLTIEHCTLIGNHATFPSVHLSDEVQTVRYNYAHNRGAGAAYGGTGWAGSTRARNASSDSSGDGGYQSIAYSTSSGAYFTGITAGSENLDISASSSLKDAATGSSETQDVVGRSRSIPDIGAFEYPSAPSSQVRSTSTAAEVSSGSLTLSEPSGAAVGDILVAIISSRGSAAFMPPSGWQQIVQVTDGNTSTTASSSIASGCAFWIRRGGSAPSYDFSRTGGDVARGVVVAIRDAREEGSPFDGVPTINTLGSNSATVTTGEITTANANSLLLLAIAGADNTTVSGYTAATDPTSGWTESHDSNTATEADTTVAVATATKASAGATGTLQATAGVSSQHVAMAFAIGSVGTTAPSDEVAVSGVTPGVLRNGQTGIVIAGSGFLNTQGAARVVISPTDDIDDPDAVEQTITSYGATSIQITAVRDDLEFHESLFLFVETDEGDSNEDGFTVSFTPATATLNFTGDNSFITNSGALQASVSGITVLFYSSARPPSSGTADQTLTGRSTDGSGEASWQFDAGSLEYGDPAFYIAFATDPDDDFFSMGEIVPDYA